MSSGEAPVSVLGPLSYILEIRIVATKPDNHTLIFFVKYLHGLCILEPTVTI
jgi:hypothetical protein